MHLLLTEQCSWFMLCLPQFFLQTGYSSDRKSSLEEFTDDNYLLLVKLHVSCPQYFHLQLEIPYVSL